MPGVTISPCYVVVVDCDVFVAVTVGAVDAADVVVVVVATVVW